MAFTYRLGHRTPYAMRHTFASFAIAAGLPTFEITRMMGTSVAMLDKTLATCSAMPPCAAEGSWTPSTRAKMRRLGLSGATE